MYKRWMQMAGREQYNNEIEANALDYGYKTANLMYLEEAVREFEASEGAAKLHELYGDIRGEVPAFKGVDARIIETHLDTHAHEWRALFENFQNHFSSQVDKSVLDEPAKESLKNLQEVIKGCFEKHQISQDLFNEFLTKNDLGINDLVMVRSTGVHEDKADMANPGGNESLPSRANILEITRALGVVAASYVGEKSLSQRLGAGDTTIAEFPVMPGLVQRMIDGNVYSGVLYSNDGSTRIQAAPGHGEYVVNSKGRVDNYYVSSEDIVYSEIRPKDFRLKPRVDLADGKVKLERAENPFELRYESALPEPVVLYLNELGKFIEKKYGKRMDMEFVYKPEAKAISIVQARSITKNKEIVLTPSAVSPDFLGMNKSKLNIVEGLQVITPDISRAAVIIDPKQVIVCNSIAEALSRYNDKSKDTGIKAVIVQNPAPDTSHEAGMFNSAGIRVMQVKDITAFENLLNMCKSGKCQSTWQYSKQGSIVQRS
ncbi:MAG: PEP/pyruvate-binding domain-containing protein [Rickettsia endosymbiont of Pentastiridius leporinus]